MVGLVGPFDRNAEMLRLTLGQLRQVRTQLLQVQTSDLLIEVLRQRVDTVVVLLVALEQLDLRDHLVGEAVRHHEARVAGPRLVAVKPGLGRDLVRERLAVSPVGGAVCQCGATWGVLPGVRGGSAGRYAAVGRILKRGGWVRRVLTAAWNTYTPTV